jgi:hypothetical protein
VHHGLLDRGWRLERLADRQVIARPPQPPAPAYGPAIHDPPPLTG